MHCGLCWHAIPTETMVLVGHDSVNRALLLQFLDLPLSSYWRIAQSPCCINEINIADGKACVLRLNETHHVDQIGDAEWRTAKI